MRRKTKRTPANRAIKKRARVSSLRKANHALPQSTIASAYLPVLFPNAQDTLVVHTLREAPSGDLAIDRFAQRTPEIIPFVRDTVCEVYLKAARARLASKATKSQMKQAKSAVHHLALIDKALDSVSFDGRDGLSRQLLGSPSDDHKGEREPNELAAECSRAKLQVTAARLVVESAIRAEERKTSRLGERRKRLRTLVDALADWWISGGGKIAPTVVANRRDGDRAVVHGLSGKFVELAVTLLCDVDEFKKSEVEAAVTNVSEERGRLKRARPSPSKNV